MNRKREAIFMGIGILAGEGLGILRPGSMCFGGGYSVVKMQTALTEKIESRFQI